MEQTDRDSLNFGALATQYYITGRAGVHFGLLTVPGNLFHHAVEYFLKMGLRKQTVEREILKNDLGHHLPKLWAEFKRACPAAALDSHDAVIDALHKFESIRYPDRISDHGMLVTATWFRAEKLTPATIAPAPPTYALVVEDVDALIKAIFEAASVNPAFYFDSVPSASRPALYRHNRSFVGAYVLALE
jgi:hypothetical protein